MLGQFKPPKDTDKMEWTRHVVGKMRYYGLSEQRIKRVLRKPKRTEEAIVPGLVAAMQPSSPTAKNPTEIWVMYKVLSEEKSRTKGGPPKIRIITAWRYPGKSPERDDPPIPDDILKEIHQLL